MLRLILKIHLYVGLTVGCIMAILAVTGALLVFESEVDHLLNAHMDNVQPQARPISIDQLRRDLEQRSPGYRVTQIMLPEHSTSSAVFHLDSLTARKSEDLYVNQYTGSVLGSSKERNRFATKVRLLHTQLASGLFGNMVVTWSTVGLAVLACSGLLLWWPRKVLAVRAGSSLPRLNNDLHHCVGFLTSWAMLMFAGTGLLLHFGHTPDEDPSAGAVTASAMAKEASIDEMILTARHCFPDGHVTRIHLPLDALKPFFFQARLPEDRTPAGRSSVTIDRNTGAVIATRSTRKAVLRYKIVKLWARELHTGDIYGWPTRIVAAICSLALGVLAFSGAMIWLNKSLASARGRRELIARQRKSSLLSGRQTRTQQT